MLFVIDSVNPAAGAGAPVRLPEVDKVDKTPETQKPEPAQEERRESGAAGQPAARRSTAIRYNGRDSAEINFSLTQEERDAFINAFSSKQDPATMTEEERSVLQQASERINKYIDEAIANNTEKRERVEKAVREWYSSIAKGEDQGPTDLIHLLRKAAMGQLSDLKRE